MEKFRFLVEYDSSMGGCFKEILPFDDYSDILIEKKSLTMGKFLGYQNSKNNNVILEGSFNRLMGIMQYQDWAIITAYSYGFTKEENIQRNRILRGLLNQNKAGVYQLVGHWREAPANMDYNDAKENELTDVVERSYLVPRPKNMDYENFLGMIRSLMTIDGETQDAVIYHRADKDGYYLMYSNGSTEQIGSNISFNKIAQAYSQYVRRMDKPFVFEGVESPGSNSGCQVLTNNNILYI